MIEIIFTRPLTIYNGSEPINSALFSRAKPLSSPRLVKLNSFNFDWKRCKTSKGFLFLAFALKMIPFLRFSLKLCSFLSLFFFRFSIMCRRVFNKKIILLGLAGYEIITNSALRTSVVICVRLGTSGNLLNTIFVKVDIFLRTAFLRVSVDGV